METPKAINNAVRKAMQGNTYKDTFYSISLYQTSPWKEIYYERSSSFISCGFSNLGNWFLVSGTSSWLMPIKEIKTGV